MIRKIIRIDEEKCVGCGACAEACHEGAIEMVNGKARLMREDYCDGLGDCLPACPVDAISFEEREAPAYDEKAVAASKKAVKASSPACGCPVSESRSIERGERAPVPSAAVSRPAQWPVQIRLVPVGAPFFDGADLLIAADCTAYAYAAMHEELMRGRVTLIGCPKLDDADYAEKLEKIISGNDIKSVTVARMEVPCCGGMEQAVKKALQSSGKFIPWRVVVISTGGEVIREM
ncbi:MAG: 4Fe-4S binding protein [Oscillospiraceae bacterium]|nr:4Fe-4S binding protein [Oscillospiraceae bacterium]